MKLQLTLDQFEPHENEQLSFGFIPVVPKNFSRCITCKKVFPKTKFHKSASQSTGHVPWCVNCRNELPSVKRLEASRKERYRKSPDRQIVDSLNYRAKKKNISGIFTVKEWQDLKASYSNTCVYCGISEVFLTVDHIEAISKGGSNSIENIAPACALCNRAKHDLPFIIFLGWLNKRLDGFMAKS